MRHIRRSGKAMRNLSPGKVLKEDYLLKVYALKRYSVLLIGMFLVIVSIVTITLPMIAVMDQQQQVV